MEIRKVKVKNLRPADYNPRQDLQPGDREYDKIANSMDEFGYIDPIVWNERTGNIVDGHQRIKMLPSDPEAEIYVSVVNLSERDEKILNVALDKIKGRWDHGKLKDVLTELKKEGKLDLSGFEDWELEAISIEYDHINDLLEEDFSEFTEKSESDTFVMTFSLPGEAREAVEKYLNSTANAKVELATAVINKVKGV